MLNSPLDAWDRLKELVAVLKICPNFLTDKRVVCKNCNSKERYVSNDESPGKLFIFITFHLMCKIECLCYKTVDSHIYLQMIHHSPGVSCWKVLFKFLRKYVLLISLDYNGNGSEDLRDWSVEKVAGEIENTFDALVASRFRQNVYHFLYLNCLSSEIFIAQAHI